MSVAALNFVLNAKQSLHVSFLTLPNPRLNFVVKIFKKGACIIRAYIEQCTKVLPYGNNSSRIHVLVRHCPPALPCRTFSTSSVNLTHLEGIFATELFFGHNECFGT